jgi:K+ transporter
MLFFFSLVPATIWIVLGYFILFSSTRTEGAGRKFGQVLAVWVFLLAALTPVMGAYGTLAGFSPVQTMQAMHAGQASGLQAGSAAKKKVVAPAS